MLGGMSKLSLLFALVPALFLIGCNTDAAVFVDPTVESPKVSVQGGALGVGVSGSFELDLHLSARASGTSTVKLGEFELDTADKDPIVSPLPIEGDKTFPLTVDQDSDVTVHFTFDSGKDPLPAAKKDALCGKSGLAIKGTIEDSLAGSSTPVFSATFDPSGC
jgi:hypothetical protein